VQYASLWTSGPPSSRAAPGSLHSSYATGMAESLRNH